MNNKSQALFWSEIMGEPGAAGLVLTSSLWDAGAGGGGGGEALLVLLQGVGFNPDPRE